MKKWFLFIILGVHFLLGCASQDVDQNNLPWARPSDWEGAPPGMSNIPGAQRGRR